MLSENIMQEIYFLIHSMLLGVAITFAYDWLRIFRRICRHNLFFVSLEDILFWIICSMQIFLMLYHKNDGILRWFAIIGAMGGMFFYKLLFGRFFVKYMVLGIKAVLHFLGRIICFITRPAVVVEKGLVHFLKKMKNFLRKLLKILRNRLTLYIKMVRILLCKH